MENSENTNNEPVGQLAIPGDVMQAGINKQNNLEHRELLQWLYFYMAEQNWSITQAATEVGVSGTTLSRLFNGKYCDPKNGGSDSAARDDAGGNQKNARTRQSRYP